MSMNCREPHLSPQSPAPLTLAGAFLFSHERLVRFRLLGCGQLSFFFLPFAHISAQLENSLLFHLVEVLYLLVFHKTIIYFLLNTLERII